MTAVASLLVRKANEILSTIINRPLYQSMCKKAASKTSIASIESRVNNGCACALDVRTHCPNIALAYYWSTEGLHFSIYCVNTTMH